MTSAFLNSFSKRNDTIFIREREMKNPPNLIIVRQQQHDEKYLPNKNITSSRPNQKGKVKLKKRRIVEEYCENSTVHGLRYFSKQDLHLSERLWWIISVFCSLVGCCILISKSYRKWDENPVIVTFSEKMSHLNDVPFPAVTICPETKSQGSIFNYSATLHKIKLDSPPTYGLSEREINLLSAQFQICEAYIIRNQRNIGENFTTDIIYDLIREVAPNMSMSIVSCKFRTLPVNIETIFQEVITDDGLCFTFNSLTPESMFTDIVDKNIMSSNNISNNYWSLEDGYSREHRDSTAVKYFLYPFRVMNDGSKTGLKLTLGIRQEDMDYACRGPVQGFKVILHTPNELPQVAGQYFRIPIGQNVRVSIKPNMLQTTESLRHQRPKRRQCFFNSERKLRYLRTYTQRNCELECLTNFTLAVCGCVKFSMPHDKDTPICGIAKLNCYNWAEDDLLEDTDSIETSMKINRCNCLPACTSITYDSEMSQDTYEYRNFFRAVNANTEEALGLHFASLSIFFKENHFITSKRSEMVTLTDFVSSCGGLLGLFMGVSILSIVEFVYYFSIRLFCSIQSNKVNEEENTMPKLKPRSSWRESKQRIKPWYIGQT